MNIELYKTSGKKDKDIFYLYRTASEYICKINNKIIFNFNKENSFFNPDNFDEEKIKNNEKYYEEFYMILVYLLLDIQKIGNKYFKDLQVIFLQQGIRDIMTSNRALQNERILILRYLVLSLNLAGNNKIEKDNFDNYKLGYLYEELRSYEIEDRYNCYEYLCLLLNKSLKAKDSKDIDISRPCDLNFIKKGYSLISFKTIREDLNKLASMNTIIGREIINFYYESNKRYNKNFGFVYINNHYYGLKHSDKIDIKGLESRNPDIISKINNKKKLNQLIIKNYFLNDRYLSLSLLKGKIESIIISIYDLLEKEYNISDKKIQDFLVSLIIYDLERDILSIEASDSLYNEFLNIKRYTEKEVIVGILNKYIDMLLSH